MWRPRETIDAIPAGSPAGTAGVTSLRQGAHRFGWVNSLLLRFLPHQLPQEDHLRRALTAVAVAVLFAFIAPLYAVLIWLLETPPAVYYGLAFEAFATAFTALALLRYGRVRGASWVLLLGGTFAVLVPFLREGSSSPAACNFVIVIVMAALLTGWRGVLGLGVPFAILIVSFEVAENRGMFHPDSRIASGGVFALMQVTSLIVMLVVFDRVRLGLLRARRELEVKLREAQRLEAVGRLAGGIAHDFNNLLTVILANATMVESTTLSPSVRQDVVMIRTVAERAAVLTKQLLAFSRQQKLEPTTFDLGGLLDDVEGMLRRVFPETIRIETDRAPTGVWLRADAGQISQVVMNLAVNARDAMPAGGTLRVVAEYAATDVLPSSLIAGRYVRLSVRDSGVGMDPTTQERIFEPFFTTKSSGTGLGLATVHGIVAQSGGAIRVTSRPGAGSAFEVFLPAAEAPASPARSAAAPAAVPSAPGRTILLVEDNEHVRLSTSRMLAARGHEVIACRGTEEALLLWETEGHRVDLVLTDVIMPDGNGPALVATLCSQRPVRVLFMSGYLDETLRDSLPAQAKFISKPFTAVELQRKIDEVTAEPQSRVGP